MQFLIQWEINTCYNKVDNSSYVRRRVYSDIIYTWIYLDSIVGVDVGAFNFLCST